MSKKKKEFIQVKLSDDQAIALKAMQVFKSDKTKKEFVLDGVGGTGKTFLIRELFSRKRPNSKKTFVPNTILGIAVTHQAVLNLKKSIPNSKTYASAASLMMEFDLNGNIYFIPKSGSTLFGSLKGYKHIVVDECSQFSVEMMNVLVKGASPDTKFYWIGE